MKNVITKIWKG